jgi:hypothetical protein
MKVLRRLNEDATIRLLRSYPLALRFGWQQLEISDRDYGCERLAVSSNDNSLATLDKVEQSAEVASSISDGHR